MPCALLNVMAGPAINCNKSPSPLRNLFNNSEYIIIGTPIKYTFPLEILMEARKFISSYIGNVHYCALVANFLWEINLYRV